MDEAAFCSSPSPIAGVLSSASLRKGLDSAAGPSRCHLLLISIHFSAASVSSWASIHSPQASPGRSHTSLLPQIPSLQRHSATSQVSGWRLTRAGFTLLLSCLDITAAPLPNSPAPVPLAVISEEPLRKKQASCLFSLQKCLSAGRLVSRCPCGG